MPLNLLLTLMLASGTVPQLSKLRLHASGVVSRAQNQGLRRVAAAWDLHSRGWLPQ